MRVSDLFIRSGQPKILDISELSPGGTPETPGIIKKKKSKSRSRKNSGDNLNQISRFTEYLAGRKYYILFLAAVYVIGLIGGAVLAKNLDQREAFDLCSAADAYFAGAANANMTARIFANIALNLAFLLGIYMAGATVFAYLACPAFCLYKGLTGGFVIGVYMIGGSSLFHLGACAVNFLLYLFTMIFFILACGESMSFSAFLFKSDESLRSSLSFKNISVYSSRYILFMILIAMSAVLQTVVMPVIYAIWG